MTYRPELDGLRAIAVLLVVLFHAAPHGPFSGGFIGVDLFFVLSAYLISSKLAENPSLWRFYWHRFCRLMPALLFMLGGYLLAAPILWSGYDHSRDALLTGLYLSDYSYAFFGVPLYLQHTWSLAVEEHFYLLWPFLFALLVKAKRPVLILAAVYVAITLWRLPWGWEQYYYRFDTHATGLVLGAILFFLRPKLSPVSAYVALMVLLMVAVVADIRHSALVITVAEFAAAVVITFPPPWLALPPLVWLGKRSYAIYLWHFPIAYAVRAELSFAVTAIISLALSIGLAAISWVTVEAWGRSLRDAVEARRRIQI